jgi:2'-5' RNA ligase
MRLFLALEVPAAVRSRIAAATQLLRERFAQQVRWVDPDAVHLTVKFLGEQSPELAADLLQRLAPRAEGHAAFDLACGGIGAFPSLRRPRVVWCGVEPNPALTLLYEDVEGAASEAGLEREQRAYRPHLTLGRLRRPLSAEEGVEFAAVGDLELSERFTVESVQLMRSDLTAAGARYERLWSVGLAGRSAGGR